MNSASTSMIGAAQTRPTRGDCDIEQALHRPAAHPLAHVQQAEEPHRRHVQERHAAEHVLEEARQPRHAEPPVGHVQQPLDRVRARLLVREHDVVGMLGLDHRGEAAQGGVGRAPPCRPPRMPQRRPLRSTLVGRGSPPRRSPPPRCRRSPARAGASRARAPCPRSRRRGRRRAPSRSASKAGAAGRRSGVDRHDADEAR